MSKKVLYAILAVSMLIGIATSAQAQNARIYNVPDDSRTIVRYKNIILSWKGNTLANRDTSITVLTGAPQAYDTTDAAYVIRGANSITLQSNWQAVNDSCLGILRADVSMDGTTWAPFPTLNSTSAAGVDSASMTAATGTFPKVKALTVPSAQFIRFRLEKYLSAATDTLKLKSFLFITFNDE